MARLRAFTLIEVVIGLTIGAVITTAAIATLSHVMQFQGEVVARNTASRDAELVIDLLGKDLVFAGAGVPRGLRRDTADFSAPVENHQLRPLFRTAKPDHFSFVGDLPYPNAELNGLARVTDVNPASQHRIVVTSEISGCAPPSSSPGSYACATSTRSLLGPLAGANCAEGSTGSRTCPWALNKWQRSTNGGGTDGVHLIFGNTDGSWHERLWSLTDFDDFDPFLVIHLEHESADGTGFGPGGEDLVRDNLLTPVGVGFASHIDRSFWSFEGTAPGSSCTAPPACVVRRRQCWGQVLDPGAANWPGVTDTAFRSNLTPLHCAPPNDGTGWEDVIDGVESFTVQYLDGNGVSLTGAWDAAQSALVKAVEVEIVVSRKAKGSTKQMTQRTKKRFFIENRGGLVGVPPAAGGCAGGGDDEGACGGDEG